jgi:hypothetical protein
MIQGRRSKPIGAPFPVLAVGTTILDTLALALLTS